MEVDNGYSIGYERSGQQGDRYASIFGVGLLYPDIILSLFYLQQRIPNKYQQSSIVFGSVLKGFLVDFQK